MVDPWWVRRRSALLVSALAMLGSACGAAPASAPKPATPPEHVQPAVCDIEWTLPVNKPSVLAKEAAERALQPVAPDLKARVCACTETLSPGQSPRSARFLISSTPAAGVAVVQLLDEPPSSPFARCFGTLTTRYPAWPLGTCMRPDGGRATIISPLVVDLSPPGP